MTTFVYRRNLNDHQGFQANHFKEMEPLELRLTHALQRYDIFLYLQTACCKIMNKKHNMAIYVRRVPNFS